MSCLLIPTRFNPQEFNGDPLFNPIDAGPYLPGITVKRSIVNGSSFWNDWAKYPFSTTDRAQSPLCARVLALAHRSGKAWNESGFSNAELDV
jgi:hypothetical protein